MNRGEKVLTSVQAKQCDSGKGGGNTFQFHVTMNGTNSSEKDADKLFDYFVKKVQIAGLNGA